MFSSALALQAIIELGLSAVIVQCASHEWAYLRQDSAGRVVGPEKNVSRLGHLLKVSLKWYFGAGVIFAAALAVCGGLVFSATPAAGVPWVDSWYIISSIAGVYMLAIPVLAVLEGCNQVSSVYAFRLVQGLAYSITLVVSLLFGCGLSSLAYGLLVRLLLAALYIGVQKRQFLLSLAKQPIVSRLDWSREVWPFQWRVGLSWLSGSIIYNIITPVIFIYHGPIEAGKMGMTWSLLTALESIAHPWVNTRIPALGALIARRQYEIADAKFRAAALAATSTAAFGGLIIIAFVGFVDILHINVSDRFLPLLPCAILVLHRVLSVAVSSVTFYTRAHKSEPLGPIYLVSAGLTCISSLTFGELYGASGISFGMLAIMCFWTVPFGWKNYKRFMHSRGARVM